MAKKSKFKKILLLTFSFIFVGLITIKIYEQKTITKQLDNQINELKQQIYDEKAKQVDYLNDKQYYQSDAYIEQTARDKFGLIKPDEKVFIIKEKSK